MLRWVYKCTTGSLSTITFHVILPSAYYTFNRLLNEPNRRVTSYQGDSFIVFRSRVLEWDTVSLHIREVLLGFLRCAGSQTWMDKGHNILERAIIMAQDYPWHWPGMKGCLLVFSLLPYTGFVTNLCSILFSKIWGWTGFPSIRWIQGYCRKTALFSCEMPKEREITVICNHLSSNLVI